MNENLIPEQGNLLRSANSSLALGEHVGHAKPPRLVNKHEAAALLGVSPETLKKYRLQDDSTLVEGIHYHVWNSRVIRYNPDLLADWGVHRHDPEAHRQAIEAYLASLACNQPKKRGRKAS